jgi:protein involved in polysaccharide export with SLBB domain
MRPVSALGLRGLVSAILAGIIASSGCSSFTGGKGSSLFPSGNRLTHDADAFRSVNMGYTQVPRELEKQSLPTYAVEPGDVLLVQPVDLDSPARLPGDQPILPDGTINLGKYGSLPVAGKTTAEIQSVVQAAVDVQTKNAGYISVRLVTRASKVYYVLGEVNAPGSFPLTGRETVLDALMAAGGITANASPNNAILSRPTKPCDCRTVLPICYDNIVQLGDVTTNYQIAPGDRIYVPSRGICETLFGRSHDKSPCCGNQTPCRLPTLPCPMRGCACGQPAETVPTIESPLPSAMPVSVKEDPPSRLPPSAR